MAPKLGYWGIRGLVEPIRYLLYYKGIEFEDKKYYFGSAPDYDRNQWLQEKFSLGLDFPNLPYYMDGAVELTQSLAILRYLARKHDLTVTTEKEIAKQDMVEQQARDLIVAFINLCYGDFEKEKKEYIKNLPDRLKPLSTYLGNKKWLMGDKLTYVDFILYEALDFHRFLVNDCLESFPNLNDYVKRIENIPAISSYMKSENYIKWPLFSPFANFAGK